MRPRPELAWLLVPLTALAVGCTDSTSPIHCEGATTHAVGAKSEGVLADGDCKDEGGRPFDLYQITLSAQTNFLLKLTPSGFDGELAIGGTPPSAGALPDEIFATTGSGTMGGRVFLPAGTYYVAVGTTSGKGSYALETSLTGSVDCAYTNRVVPGVTITGVITTSDCAGNGVARQDIYEMTLQGGRTYTFSGTREKPGTVALFTGPAGSTPLREQTVLGSGSLPFSLSYTPAKTDFYRVHLFTDPPATGPVGYTLSIQ